MWKGEKSYLQGNFSWGREGWDRIFIGLQNSPHFCMLVFSGFLPCYKEKRHWSIWKQRAPSGGYQTTSAKSWKHRAYFALPTGRDSTSTPFHLLLKKLSDNLLLLLVPFQIKKVLADELTSNPLPNIPSPQNQFQTSGPEPKSPSTLLPLHLLPRDSSSECIINEGAKEMNEKCIFGRASSDARIQKNKQGEMGKSHWWEKEKKISAGYNQHCWENWFGMIHTVGIWRSLLTTFFRNGWKRAVVEGGRNKRPIKGDETLINNVMLCQPRTTSFSQQKTSMSCSIGQSLSSWTT